MGIRDYLIEDIKNLDEDNIHKLYKYVRRHLIANIEGLVDPLDPPKAAYVYIVKNDYMPEPGSWILGHFSSKEKAEKALEDAREDYGLTEQDFDNFEIVSATVY